ncbi:MAG: response regulator [Clostridia bacterium]|nr:response regulator [Clostridia bacterium]
MNPITLLVIDDDQQICFALEELFKFQGWQVYTAENVCEGLRLFKEKSPDMVLIDYHMPDINGVEGVRRLRMMSSHTPIMVLTIEESQEVADAFLEAGASDFANKPIKALDMISRVKLHLRLMEKKSVAAENVPKGLSGSTMELIAQFMEKNTDFATISSIAEGTGLAYQATNRYLQHLEREGSVEKQCIYGTGGRPKYMYRKINMRKSLQGEE